jgi:replicative DNA helicase
MSDRSALIPPHDLDAEQAVLGGALLDPLAAQLVADADPRIFYAEKHRLIAEAIAAIVRRGDPVDLLTTQSQLVVTGHLGEVGGSATLALLADVGATAISAEAYIATVKERASRRELMSLGIDLTRQAGDEAGTETSTLTAEAIKRLLDLDSSRVTGIVTPARFAEELANIKAIDAIKTGIPSIDNLIGGFAPENLIVLAGRPGMGKTAFSIQICHNVAVERSVPVLFISLEMSREEIGMRLEALEGGLDSSKIREGHYGPDVLARPLQAIERSGFHILDEVSTNLNEVQAQIRRGVGRYKAKLVIIDHIGKIQVPKPENRYVEVGRIASGLKDTAKQLHVPLLALCQLNRAVESRTIPRPTMADLRDSGRIEEEADIIMFMWTDEERHEDKDQLPVNVLLGKTRHTKRGERPFMFHKKSGRFTEVSDRSEPEPGGTSEELPF